MAIDVFKYMGPAHKVAALKSAFDCGLVDALLRAPAGLPAAGLHRRLKLAPRGAELLLRLLAAFGAARTAGGKVRLTPGFRRDLADVPGLVRELTAYMDLAYGDLQDLPALLRTGRPGGRVKGFFEYTGSRAVPSRVSGLLSPSTANYAGMIAGKYPFGKFRRALDAGGNDGTFMASLCRKFPRLKGMVFDVPGQCAIGAGKFRPLVKAGRLEFFPGDFFSDPLPSGADLVIFKSVLNDWPDRAAAGLLAKAHAALPGGGKLLVIERLDPGAARTGDDCLFDLAFMQFIAPAQDFRTFRQYKKMLAAAGFSGARLLGCYSAGFCIIECSKK